MPSKGQSPLDIKAGLKRKRKSLSARASSRPRQICETGELFDLTVASMNNPFGCLKEKWAQECGPFQPIERYIAEYDMMLSTRAGVNDQLDEGAASVDHAGVDDKNSKRFARLQFLNEASKHIELRKLFLCVSGYLNGAALLPSTGDDDEPIKQPIKQIDHMYEILMAEPDDRDTVASARMMNDRWVEQRKQTPSIYKPAPFKMFFVGGNVILFFAAVIDNIANGGGASPIKSAAMRVAKSASHLAHLDYSDLDYTILPCSTYEWREWLMTRCQARSITPSPFPARLEGSYRHPDAGFLLMRVKTSFCVKREGPQPPDITPKVDKLFKDRGLFASPQSAQIGYMHDLKLSDTESRRYMNFLLSKKAVIASATKLNAFVTALCCTPRGQDKIDDIASAAANVAARQPRIPAISADWSAIQTSRLNIATEILRQQDRWDLTRGLMQYVHTTVVNANSVIASWPRLGPISGSGSGMGGPAQPTTWDSIIGSCSQETFYRDTLGSLYDVLTGPEDPSGKPYGQDDMLGPPPPPGRTALIPRMCTTILINFMNNDGRAPGRLGSVPTNDIVDAITKLYSAVGLQPPEATSSPFKVIDVSRSPTLSVEATEAMNQVRTSNLPFPDNLNIGINKIVTATETDHIAVCTDLKDKGLIPATDSQMGGGARRRTRRRRRRNRKAGRPRTQSTPNSATRTLRRRRRRRRTRRRTRK